MNTKQSVLLQTKYLYINVRKEYNSINENAWKFMKYYINNEQCSAKNNQFPR